MKNNEKKTLIIQEARKLFYDKGYNDTNLKEIAAACGIRKQTVSYYFGAKANLGLAVYDQISDEFLAFFRERALKEYAQTDKRVIDAASTLWTIDYYKADKKALRFYEEFIFGTLTSVDVIAKERERHRAISYLGEPDELVYTGARFAAIGSLYYYCEGKLSVDEDAFGRYYIGLIYSAYIKDEKILDDIYNQAKALCGKLILHWAPYFVLM